MLDGMPESLEPAGGARALPPGLRVGIIDRDSGFVQVLTKRLELAGWQHRVLAAAPPPSALAPLRLSAVVVDVDLLGPRGFEWLERLCDELPALGILVCSRQSTVMQRVRGLRLGADDWIAKPCHPEEVVARVEAVVRRRRRASGTKQATMLQAGDLEIRGDKFQAFVDGRSIDLTRREFALVELLARAAARVLEREEIYQRVWGYEMVRGDRSVDVFVRKLRQKLEKASPAWRYVHTHFGVGYRFEAEPLDAGAADGPPGVSEDTAPVADDLLEPVASAR